MYNGIKVTNALIGTTIASWIAWDIYVASNKYPGDTESEVIRTLANQHPAFPYTVGILMGHFFWNVTEGVNPWLSRLLMPALVCLVSYADFKGWTGHINPVMPFILGFTTGHCLWPQRMKV